MTDSEQCVTTSCSSCKQAYATSGDYHQHGKSWRICKSGHLWFECCCGATQMLTKGNYPWYSPARFLKPETMLFFHDEEALSKFPHLPSALMKLQQAVRNPMRSSNDIASILKQVPALATEVLRLANNIKTARGAITTLDHAVSYLGRATICYLALLATVQSYKVNTQVFSLKTFWQEAFLTGLISEALAMKFSSAKQADIAYLCGCLCNIGKLIGAICYPKQVDKITELLDDSQNTSSWSQIEKTIKVPSHIALGDAAATLWGLPKEIHEAILYHHQPLARPLTANPQLSLAECAAFASMLSHWILLNPYRIDKAHFVSFEVYLKMSSKETEAFVQTLLPLRELSEKQVASSTLIR